MLYKFQNKNHSIEVDVQVWLSLLELAEENGAQLQGDYTPTWALGNMKKESRIIYPVQVVTNEDVIELTKSLERILAIIPPDADNKRMNRKQMYRRKTVEVDGTICEIGTFLGLFNGTASFTSTLFSLEYFFGANSEIVQELIQFLQGGEFKIDWTPIVEPK